MGCGASAPPALNDPQSNSLAAQGDPVKREQVIGMRRVPINKDYIVKSQVGKGAFGTVTIAEHRTLKQTRAIKKIPKKLVDKDELAASIARKEFDMLRSVDHPHVLRVYEMFEDDVACYIVTEMMEGGELYDRVVELNFLSEEHAREITLQLVTAVSTLHSCDVVHRDIKPENILLDSKDGQPFIKVCDFGFACVKPKEGMSEAIGTPYYVAPEVLSGKRYDQKCDVWSVGVVVYVMLSGRTPFNADNLAAIAREIRACRYTFKFPEFDKVSPEALDFVRTCLQVDTELRPSMAEMLQHKWLQPDWVLVKHCTTGNGQRCECSDCTGVLEIQKELRTNLQNFSRGDKFQQGIITFILSHMEMTDETKVLSKLFRKLDKDGNGKLSQDELLEGLETINGIFGVEYQTSDAQQVMAAMDMDQDNRVEWTEFLAAMVDHSKLLSEGSLIKLFETMDEDNSNEISLEELKCRLDAAGISKRNEEAWALIIQNADADKSKSLNQKEFVDTMKQFL